MDLFLIFSGKPIGTVSVRRGFPKHVFSVKYPKRTDRYVTIVAASVIPLHGIVAISSVRKHDQMYASSVKEIQSERKWDRQTHSIYTRVHNKLTVNENLSVNTITRQQ